MLKPMDKELTVQIHHPDRGWMKCATLHFDDRLELGPVGAVSIRYLDDYILNSQNLEIWKFQNLESRLRYSVYRGGVE